MTDIFLTLHAVPRKIDGHKAKSVNISLVVVEYIVTLIFFTITILYSDSRGRVINFHEKKLENYGR